MAHSTQTNRFMTEHSTSPAIEQLSWGIMDVYGLGTGKDVKLWPGGGRAWDWNETHTRHVPGIQVADIAELIDHGAEVIVLSRGMNLVLQTAPETVKWLHRRGLEYHILETREAAKLYNELARQGVAVGGLFHSTC
ncbi:MAG: Mth938-like domain-containing protein [Steroidobacteraceae bacterium]